MATIAHHDFVGIGYPTKYLEHFAVTRKFQYLI